MPFPVPAELVSQGWIGLFDGHSLFGWRAETDANWRVDEGTILVNRGRPGLLRTASQFDQFEILLEYEADRNSINRLFLLTSPRPSSTDCLSVDLAGSENFGKTGSMSGSEPTGLPAYDRSKRFQQVRVRVDANACQVEVNGTTVTSRELGDISIQRGYIGLGFEAGQIRFSKVWLRPLNLNPEFDPRKGNQFEVSTENGFQAEWIDDSLKLNGGPGYVESHSQFANFMLQLQCKITEKGNSGVFYRCIPNENTNGYEAQIDNSIDSESKARPANCGTGGIFRRKDARSIVADDESWFAKTIVAEGPHVAVWVNGYQVTDWTDKRSRHANPRRGLRKEKGTLMLQGHDDDTTVRFRGVQAREMQPRRKR